ncbi:hypothetical protein AZE42_09575, partial [Rhizopogon vesiculosus]
MEFTQV